MFQKNHRAKQSTRSPQGFLILLVTSFPQHCISFLVTLDPPVLSSLLFFPLIPTFFVMLFSSSSSSHPPFKVPFFHFNYPPFHGLSVSLLNIFHSRFISFKKYRCQKKKITLVMVLGFCLQHIPRMEESTRAIRGGKLIVRKKKGNRMYMVRK